MRFHFFICILCLYSCATPQPKRKTITDTETIKNYGFLLHSREGKEGGMGTAFFLREGSKFYMLTNYHVFTGFDALTGTGEARSDINLRIRTDSGLLDIPFAVKRDDVIERKIRDLEFPDLIAVRIDNKAMPFKIFDKYVLDIGDVLDSAFYDREPEKIVVFGFPTRKAVYYKKQDRIDNEGYLMDTNYSRIENEIYSKISRGTITLSKDTFVEKYKKNYRIFGGLIAGPGYSGSLVFGQFTVKGKKVYKIIGIIRGGNDQFSVVVRMSELRKVLEQYHSQ